MLVEFTNRREKQWQERNHETSPAENEEGGRRPPIFHGEAGQREPGRQEHERAEIVNARHAPQFIERDDILEDIYPGHVRHLEGRAVDNSRDQ